MSHGPLTRPDRFYDSVRRLCAQIRQCGAVPVLYATWAYRKGGDKLAAKGWDYDEMARGLSAAYRRAAQENDALLADVGASFTRSRARWICMLSDGVHPSEQGARLRQRCSPPRSKNRRRQSRDP